MDNYALSQENARKTFLQYDQSLISSHPGVSVTEDTFSFPFLGFTAFVNRETGAVTIEDQQHISREADFSQAFTVYDWLCSPAEHAHPAHEYCPVHALPGVVVRGKGLSMTGGSLPALIDRKPQVFSQACKAMGGASMDLGDICWKIPLFPQIFVLVKFYYSDDEFPASMTILWDKNILKFIKYETVYYAADCLLEEIRRNMDLFSH